MRRPQQGSNVNARSKNGYLLITGASSATGVAAVQAGKFVGAHVLGTSGSDENLARLKTIGLDACIRTRAADFAAKVKEVTGGKGADFAVICAKNESHESASASV